MRGLTRLFHVFTTRLRRLRDRGRRSRYLSALTAAHHKRRIAEIQADLSRAAPGFIFIVGDSNAELLGEPRLGPAVVNGGIGATLASDVAILLKRLTFETRASVAVVVLGQNETLIVNGPMSWLKKARFRSALSRIERFLRTRADVIIFSKVPPHHRLSTATRDPLALDYCSRSLTAFCADGRCVLSDLFEDVRSGESCLVHDATAMDASGVHLADYGPVARRLQAVLETLAPDGAIRNTEGSASGRKVPAERRVSLAHPREPNAKTGPDLRADPLGSRRMGSELRSYRRDPSDNTCA